MGLGYEKLCMFWWRTRISVRVNPIFTYSPSELLFTHQSRSTTVNTSGNFITYNFSIHSIWMFILKTHEKGRFFPILLSFPWILPRIFIAIPNFLGKHYFLQLLLGWHSSSYDHFRVQILQNIKIPWIYELLFSAKVGEKSQLETK